MEQPSPAPGDRPLGRGLEHVSRVFLTQPPERFTGPGGERPPVRPHPIEELTGGGAVLLRPSAQRTREEIGAALKELVGGVEDGLGIIDAAIPCPPSGEIDFLAVDGRSQLALIAFDTSPSDELLIRGLAQVDWMIGNVSNLRRMFRGYTINFSLPPRLFLLAPQFSARARSAARQVATPEIEWVRYHLLETPGRPGVFFERLPEE